jgi:Xaa-Pro dipeptidase
LVPDTSSSIIHEFSHTVNKYFTIEERLKVVTDWEENIDWSECYVPHLTEWTERLSTALAASEFDSVVIFAGVENRRFRDDLPFPYSAEPYFKAWLPFGDRPGSALKITPGKRPILVEFRDEGFWHATPREPEGYWVEHFDIRQADTEAGVLRELSLNGSRVTAIGEPSRQTEGFASLNDEALFQYLDYFRAYKTAYEVQCITRANEIAALGHVAVKRSLCSGVSEFDLHRTYCTASSQTETELPYPNIVSLNEHASILHYQMLDRQAPTKTRSCLLDAGAQFNGYASDVSRSYAFDDGEFESLIHSMEVLQLALCDQAMDGVDFMELNEIAHQLLANVLKAHDIVRCNEADAYSSGITRSFLPHGLGHLLGLQVHDVGGKLTDTSGATREAPDEHPMLRLTRKLEPGMVVTIEPGLYFIPSLLAKLKLTTLARSINWDRIAALLPYGGIRVEDDVLVTDSASRNLSRPALDRVGESKLP